ncbi:MAG: hypothetical protein UZ03_NOB001002614 [Nitrospira sp. OLB3]|nr:MAG: hypothetical protein UZ03_NOB001002614 [Nitrospira sp. OLB3]
MGREELEEPIGRAGGMADGPEVRRRQERFLHGHGFRRTA